MNTLNRSPAHQIAFLEPELEALLLATKLVTLTTWVDLVSPQSQHQVVHSVGKRAEVGIGPGAQAKHSIPTCRWVEGDHHA